MSWWRIWSLFGEGCSVLSIVWRMEANIVPENKGNWPKKNTQEEKLTYILMDGELTFLQYYNRLLK